MKKTISILITAFFVLCTATTMAQHPSATFFGGANMASVDVKYGSTTTELEDSYKLLYGMNIGAFYDYVLNKDRSQEISVESGFIFENKGYHQKPNEIQSSDNKATLYYVDVPLYLKYRHRFRSRNKLYFGAGPYIGMGLFGNSNNKNPEAEDVNNKSESIKWGNDSMEDDYKRLDYGLSGKMGFLFLNGLNVCVSYDYGLANISAINTKELNNRVLRLSVGYTITLDD